MSRMGSTLQWCHEAELDGTNCEKSGYRNLRNTVNLRMSLLRSVQSCHRHGHHLNLEVYFAGSRAQIAFKASGRDVLRTRLSQQVPQVRRHVVRNCRHPCRRWLHVQCFRDMASYLNPHISRSFQSLLMGGHGEKTWCALKSTGKSSRTFLGSWFPERHVISGKTSIDIRRTAQGVRRTRQPSSTKYEVLRSSHTKCLRWGLFQ